MNRCEEMLSQIAFFLDDELQDGERTALKAHLGYCGKCHELFEIERAFLDTIRGVGPLYTAPPELRAGAERILSEAPAVILAPSRLRRRLKRSLWRSGSGSCGKSDARRLVAIASTLVFASILVILGVIRYGSGASRHNPSDFANTAVDAHLRHLRGQLPLEIASGAVEEVSAWFSGKVPFAMELPKSQELSDKQRPYALEGARLVGFKNDYAAYVAYKIGAHPVSLLVTSAALGQPSGGDEVVSRGIAFHYDTISGLNVITWEDRGLAYALVSDLDKRGRESCVVCHQGPKDQARADLGDLFSSAAP
jgi:anti-sigma factor RsiW